MCLNSLLDITVHCKLNRSKQALDKIQIPDVCRILHTTVKNFTYISMIHSTFSRLDQVFVKHFHLHQDPSTTIRNITLLDHTPIRVDIRIANHNRKNPIIGDLTKSSLTSLTIL